MSLSSFIEILLNPVTQAPTLGCMIIGSASGLIGSLALIQKKALLSETLSHSCYPGIAIAVVLSSSIFFSSFSLMPLAFCGALIFALLTLGVIHLLKLNKVHADSALAFSLAAFFGLGIVIASHIQFSHTADWRKVQSYLFGQAATLTDEHLYLYLGFLGLSALLITVFFKEIQIALFDPFFAQTAGIRTTWIHFLFSILVALNVILGIRSLGVILTSGLLIAPAVAARQMTNKLHKMLFLASLIGALSGYFGSWISYQTTLATGPSIVLVAVLFTFLSLLFSPQKGLVLNAIRAYLFKFRSAEENVLKWAWKKQVKNQAPLTKSDLKSVSSSLLFFLMRALEKKRLLKRIKNEGWTLTSLGILRAERIMRLHRLWEIYLFEKLGTDQDDAHYFANEIEHVLTPEMEKELSLLLKIDIEDDLLKRDLSHPQVIYEEEKESLV